ncbi:hypothetical protein LOTGIDRAFT_112154, partial [Lottia gigantea]
EELYNELQREIDRKTRIEREIMIMKDTYLEQVKREKSYRDEMAQQLQLVRETLSSHDALHNFSCKMLAARHCEDCPCQEPGLGN